MARRLELALLAGYAAFYLYLTFALTPARLVNGVLDDSFYYLQVARNLAHGLGSTFDGVEPTNGYHPLWLWLLVPVHWVTRTPEAALRGATLLGGALGLLALLQARRLLARQVGGWAPFLGLALFSWPRFFKQSTSLLETGLVLVLLLEFVRRWTVLRGDERAERLRLGALLGAIALARLDTVFLWPCAGAALAFRVRGTPWSRCLAAAALLTVAGLVTAPYLAWNLVTFGHLQPISAAMKSSFPTPHWDASPLIRFPEFTGLLVLGGLFAWRFTRGAGPLEQALGILGLGGLLHALWTLLFMRWGVDFWHFTLALPVALLGVPLLLERARSGALTRVPWIARRARPLGVAGVALIVLAALGLQARSLALRDGRWLASTRELALWAREHLPPGSVCATTDAGVFAYFSERPTINLDGLINNYRYRDALLSGRLQEYLAERGVTHILDQYAVGRPDWIAGAYVSRPYRIWDRPRARVAGEITLYREDEVRRLEVRSRTTAGSPRVEANAITLWKLRLAAPRGAGSYSDADQAARGSGRALGLAGVATMIEILGSGWVRFRFEESSDSGVFLVGDFNDWNETSHPMSRQEDGTYVALVHLNPGEYQFKYKTGSLWHNDQAAHEYVPNPWGSENSVVRVLSELSAHAMAGGSPPPPPV